MKLNKLLFGAMLTLVLHSVVSSSAKAADGKIEINIFHIKQPSGEVAAGEILRKYISPSGEILFLVTEAFQNIGPWLEARNPNLYLVNSSGELKKTFYGVPGTKSDFSEMNPGDWHVNHRDNGIDFFNNSRDLVGFDFVLEIDPYAGTPIVDSAKDSPIEVVSGLDLGVQNKDIKSTFLLSKGIDGNWLLMGSPSDPNNYGTVQWFTGYNGGPVCYFFLYDPISKKVIAEGNGAITPNSLPPHFFSDHIAQAMVSFNFEISGKKSTYLMGSLVEQQYHTMHFEYHDAQNSIARLMKAESSL